MAELPDLSVFADILDKKFSGQTLKRLDVTVDRKLNITAAGLKAALEYKQLTAVKREGKTLQFKFSGEVLLGLHLMLRGALVDLTGDEVPRFQILAFHFNNGKGFAVIDMQKQATATLDPIKAVAPDALDMSREYFSGLLAKKKTLIKTLLMDQKLIRGIGNSYADEILYHAGISPFSVAALIPPEFAGKLYKSVHKVLDKAIKKIAEANDDELQGELKDFMEIHSPRLKVTASGREIKTEKIGGRTTYYTEDQQLFT